MKSLLIVDTPAAATAATLFQGSMEVRGNTGAPEDDFDTSGFAGRDVVLWCHYATFLAERIAPVAARVRIVNGDRTPLSFGGSGIAAAHYAKANITAYSAPEQPAATEALPEASAPAVAPPVASVTPITEARTRRQEKPAPSPADHDYTPLSDDSLARAFTLAHPELRYVAQWGKWLAWDGAGGGWRADTTLRVFDLARQLCAEQAAAHQGAATPSALVRCKSAGARAAVENLARADRAHAADAEQWDADRMLLNTPGGVVDLRTGSIRPVRLDDYCLKVAAATPRDIPTPKWLAFLEQTTGGDAAMMGYLRRLSGYALTGDTREDFLGFIYGPGGNGKSVFMDTLQRLLGSYAINAGMDTFTESKVQGSHSEDVARLAGARLVIAQETEQGKRWNEQRVLALTGGGKITARRLYEGSFEFSPQCKLIFSGNHKPALRNVGDNFRRRFNIIPFLRKPDVVNKGLRDELWDERDGILFWALTGCIEWQCDGLQPPESVRAATIDYFENQDILGQWIADHCDVGIGYETTIRALYPSYRAYCDTCHEFALRQGELRDALLARGVELGGYKKAPLLKGIRLKPSTDAASSGRGYMDD